MNEKQERKNSCSFNFSSSQTNGPWMGTANVDVPVWLHRETGKSGGPAFGNLDNFLNDTEIDKEAAFRTLVVAARKQFPINFRQLASKPGIDACYNWLAGKLLAGGSQEKQELIGTLLGVGLHLEDLESRTVKELRLMIEMYEMLPEGLK